MGKDTEGSLLATWNSSCAYNGSFVGTSTRVHLRHLPAEAGSDDYIVFFLFFVFSR